MGPGIILTYPEIVLLRRLSREPGKPCRLATSGAADLSLAELNESASSSFSLTYQLKSQGKVNLPCGTPRRILYSSATLLLYYNTVSNVHIAILNEIQ